MPLVVWSRYCNVGGQPPRKNPSPGKKYWVANFETFFANKLWIFGTSLELWQLALWGGSNFTDVKSSVVYVYRSVGVVEPGGERNVFFSFIFISSPRSSPSTITVLRERLYFNRLYYHNIVNTRLFFIYLFFVSKYTRIIRAKCFSRGHNNAATAHGAQQQHTFSNRFHKTITLL